MFVCLSVCLSVFPWTGLRKNLPSDFHETLYGCRLLFCKFWSWSCRKWPSSSHFRFPLKCIACDLFSSTFARWRLHVARSGYGWQLNDMQYVDATWVMSMEINVKMMANFTRLLGLAEVCARLGFKTSLSKTKTKTCLSKTKTKTQQFQDQDQDLLIQDQDQDSAVSRPRPRPRLAYPRPRPRLQTYKSNTGSPWLDGLWQTKSHGKQKIQHTSSCTQ